MFLKFFISLAIVNLVITQQCYPNFFVEQAFQNSISLQFTSQQKSSAGKVQKTYNHSYWPDMFQSSKPNVAFCMHEMSIKPTKDISYSLKAKVHNEVIQFTLSSKGVSWLILNIQMWLFNRQDFYTQTFSYPINSLASTQNTKQFYQVQSKLNIPLILKTLSSQQSSTSKSNFQLIYQTYLLGLQSSTTSLATTNHQVNINDFYLNDQEKLRIEIQTEYQNKISLVQIMVIFVPVETSELVSYEIDFVYENLVQSYELLNGRFHPVFNILLGIKSLSFQSQKPFELIQKYDLMNSMMMISTNLETKTIKPSPIQFIELSYVSFGRIMNRVCQPCSTSYVLIDGCRTKCQEGYHEKKYYDSKGKQSGKTCVKCLDQLNMEYNSEYKSCICKKDHFMSDFGTRCDNNTTSTKPQLRTLNSETQIATSLQKQCPIKGTIYKSGKCQCQDPSLNLIDGACKRCQIAPKLIYDPKAQKCKSIIEIEGCKQLNFQPNANFTQCVCKKGFEKWMSKCLQMCKENSVRDKLNGTCVCITGYQFNKQKNTCQIQPKQPSKSSTQTKTQSDPLFMQQTLKISLATPKPLFMNPGIVFDLLITPTIPHTQQQVNNMFQITFSDNKLAPISVYISQNQNNLKQYRILFDYRSNLPYRTFDVSIRVNQKRLGMGQNAWAKLVIPINPLNTGRNFAIRGQEAILI